MALPAAVATQIAALNAAANKLLADRDRVVNIFDDGLGASAYSLLSPANQQATKIAITNDMVAARDQISAAITALQAM
jgi:hypothetical protein